VATVVILRKKSLIWLKKPGVLLSAFVNFLILLADQTDHRNIPANLPLTLEI
jgi:hypothetical protein